MLHVPLLYFKSVNTLKHRRTPGGRNNRESVHTVTGELAHTQQRLCAAAAAATHSDS